MKTVIVHEIMKLCFFSCYSKVFPWLSLRLWQERTLLVPNKLHFYFFSFCLLFNWTHEFGYIYQGNTFLCLRTFRVPLVPENSVFTAWLPWVARSVCRPGTQVLSFRAKQQSILAIACGVIPICNVSLFLLGHNYLGPGCGCADLWSVGELSLRTCWWRGLFCWLVSMVF